MERTVFDRFSKIVYDASGIVLAPGKESLVSSRVSKRMRTLGLATHEDYLRVLKEDRSGEELVQLLDVISTNVTSFFREPEHFEFLRARMQKWLSQGQRRFRIWSAASSTGEEPYTLAMVLSDVTRDYQVDIKILATDISTRVLETCKQGIYKKEKLDTVPQNLLRQYFNVIKDGSEPSYEAKDCLKKMIVFKRLNLSTPPFPMKGPFDFVLCRNVMIYFDNTIRRNLLGEVYRLVKQDGYLLVGHTESLTGMVSQFKTVCPSVYVKAD